MEEGWYEGSDLKFLVEMTASGFNMDDDHWAVGVQCGTKIVRKYEKEECIRGNDGKWYVCVDRDVLKKGELSLVAYAAVPDTDFEDGFRDEVDKSYMGLIKKV